MADQKHTVELEIVANAKQVREEIKEVTKQANTLGNLSSRMQKSGLKGHKEVAKLAKQSKDDPKSKKKAIDAEKKLHDAMKRTAGAMREKLKASKGNISAVEKELAEIKKLESAYKKLQKGRKSAHGETGGEKFRRGMGGAGRGIRGALGGIGKGIAGAGLGIGAGLLGIIMGQLTGGYAEKQQYGKAMGGLMGMGGSKAQLTRARNRGVPMGFGPIETAQQTRTIAQQTGSLDAVTDAQRLSRATGMGVTEMGGAMGALARGGRGFGAGQAGKKDMEKTIAAGFESGLDRARMPEFIQGVAKLVEGQSAVTAGAVNPGSINRILSALGASGQSGLQGARGVAVTQRLDQAVKKPGGGEAGQAFMLRALGFGQPGGETSYYDALKMQQKGITGKGGAKVLQKVFEQSKMEYGGGEQQALALSNMTGLTIDQVESVRKVMEDGNLDQESKMDQVAEITKEAKSIDEKIHDELKEFGEVVKHQAKMQDHSVGVGEAIEDEVHSIQNLINEMVTEILPAVKIALKVMVSILKDIWDWIKSTPFFKGSEKEQYREMSRDIYEEVATAKADVRAGKMSPAEYANIAKKRASELRELAEESGDIGLFNPMDIGREVYGQITGQGSVNTERKRTALTAKQTAARLEKIHSSTTAKYGNFDSTEDARLASLVIKQMGLKEGQNPRVPESATLGDFSPGKPLHGLIEDALNRLVDHYGDVSSAVEALARTQNEGASAGKRSGGAKVDTSGGAH